MSAVPGSLAPGSVLDGKYEIVGLLGSGGMGDVYKARHIHLGAFRCIKLMKPTLMADESYRQRFLREAQLATQIHHPNVAVVHDFSILENGTSYMVTEFIDGTTVRQWEAQNGRFPLALATDVAMQVLAGLDYIHRRGLLHRDISADNVMLAFDRDDHLLVKIIDLGVAKDVSTSAVDTTQAGIFMGNPKYMSPEQLGEMDEGEALDGRTDLYSLGVVFYELLTGVPPFTARSANGYIIKHLTEAPPSFRAVNPDLDLPPGLEEVVFRALEKNRTKRHASARAFAEALSPFVSHIPRTFSRTHGAPAPKTVSTEERAAAEAWEAAMEVDTYAALRDFRARFPSFRPDEAERVIEERLAFETAAAVDTEAAWMDYLERWSDDRHVAAAQERMNGARIREETAYSVALSSKSAVGWAAFLDEFPDSVLSQHAEEHLREAVAYNEARSRGRGALDEFLRTYPDGIMAKEAKRRLGVLDAADDIRGWQEANALGTPAALQAYLRAHPDGQFAPDARRAIARVAIVEGDFNSAWEAGTVAAWDEWLNTYGESARADEARRCRQEAAEFEMAASVDTKGMWRAFLKAWPDGRHRLDVELRLRLGP